MKILLVGVNNTNINYKKIEGFYNSFSNFGNVEWVQNIFLANETDYDLCFGEIDIDEILNNIEKYNRLKIKNQIFWVTLGLGKIKLLSELLNHINFTCLYKSNILNDDILIQYKKKYGNNYQNFLYEGIIIDDFINIQKKISDNLNIDYLPCCLGEKTNFIKNKEYDMCYFGTLNNRPNVKYILDYFKKKYNVISNGWDLNPTSFSPDDCIEIYKKTKLTISEQIQPVVLEYPVRLGECSVNGCVMFLLEDIPLKCENKMIPNYISGFNNEDLINKIENILNYYDVNMSYELHKTSENTYNDAVKFLLNKINYFL